MLHATSLMAEPRKHTNEFFCHNCDPKGLQKLGDVKTHLRDVHGIDATKVKGQRKGLCFLDGSDFYSNTFEWTFPCEVGEVKLTQISSGPRGRG